MKSKNKVKSRQKLRKGLILLSFFLFPATYYYFSPVLIIEAGSKGIVNGSFILFSLMFFSSLLLGRAFCGWVCPAAGCQESIFQARSRKISKGNFIKWLIWVPWICSIILFTIRSGGYKRIDFFYMTKYGFSIADLHDLIIYFIILLFLIVLPAFLVGKRSFCHHFCWMSPFMIIGRKIRNYFQWGSLQLNCEPEICEHCRTCTENCPMSLPVEKMVNQKKMENSECILCGTCVDGCKQGAITYQWGRKRG